MRRELSPNARLLSVGADGLPERLPGHARTPSRDEQVTAGLFLQQHRPAVLQILPHMVRRFLPYRHDAFLAPLSHARKGPKGKVQLLNLEPDQFAHSKSRSIKNLQHRAIPAAQRFGAVGLLKEPRDFPAGEKPGERFEGPRGHNLFRGITLDHPIPEKEPEEQTRSRERP